MTLTPDSLFSQAAQSGASDVHVAVGIPVFFRIDGTLTPQDTPAMTREAVEQFLQAILTSERLQILQEKREMDVSYQLENGVRLRVNCHFERGNPGLVARIIPTQIPTPEALDLVDIVENLSPHKQGLILFTGPTGTGKSTSLASMIQHINSERGGHIVTFEDPIEFIFPKGKGIVRQRQYLEDFRSFAEALKRVLRQDPDVILVGEMRDAETMTTALTLAETGHLVFATLHTPDTAQTVDRIVDVFPPHQQEQIRSQLSFALKAIIAQRLLPKVDGGLLAQREVFINTHAAANIIRENRTQELGSVLQTGKESGMRTFEQDAKRLLAEGLITKETFEWAVGTPGDS